MTFTFYAPFEGHNSIAEIANRLKRRFGDKARFVEIGSEEPEDPCVVFTTLENLRINAPWCEGKPLWTVWEGEGLFTDDMRGLRRVGPIALPSTYNQAAFQRSGFPSVLIPYGVDLDVWKPREKSCDFCAYSYVSARKNVRCIDDAFKMAETGGKLCFKLWGDYADGNGMTSFAATLKGDAVWTHLTEEGLAEWVGHHRVFANASLCEGFSLPVLEAMAAGVPPIVPNYSGQLDFVNNDNGWLVDTDPVTGSGIAKGVVMKWRRPRVDHMAQVMRHIASNPDEVEAKAAAARKTAEAYPWSRTFESLRAFAEQHAKR